MEFTFKPEKNLHNVGNSPNYHSNCFIVDRDAPDVLECPLCRERDERSDAILDSEIIE